MSKASEHSSAAVRLDRLTKRYGATVAVEDLTFSIDRGTIAAFLGPNGAGKTTTFKILAGLASPSSGTAQLLGRDYANLDDPIRQVGAMLEISGYHPTRTARQHLEMLALAGGVAAQRVDDLLGLVELQHAADRAVGGFSSGMRQRLGLAAALLGDPMVLLLDEPANGLDPKGIRWLRDFLRALAHEHDKTVFVSSHILAEIAQMVDEVVIIDRGRLITQGPIEMIVSHMGSAVSVRSPDADRLAGLVERRGVLVDTLENGRILISGLDIEEVGRIAAEHRVVLHELREEGRSLEETFLALTEEDIE